MSVLHGPLRSQLDWYNLLRRLHSVSHWSTNLLGLHWPHYRLGSEYWTSELLRVLDWLLLIRSSMLLLLVLAGLRMLLTLRLLLLWVLLRLLL